MKKFVALNLFLAITAFSFAQETFTSKQQAINFLKATFSKYFIKTEVREQQEDKEYRFFYDYEITETCIKIHSKYTNDGRTSVDYTIMKFGDINKIQSITTKERSGYYKNSTGLKFKSNYPSFQSPTSSSYSQMFPFDLTKDEHIEASIINALNAITREDKAVAKTAKEKLIIQSPIDNKIAFTELPPYVVFTSTNSTTSLPEYIVKNRRFKDKPTLLVTWSNKWCLICIKKIDTLLNSGLALKYNIVLINKEGTDTDFSELKTKISNHTPDYNTDAILLFDKNNQLEPIDKNGAPFFIWLDKNLKIVRSYAGYDISVTTINNILAEIE